jgi:Flp pilus assembly protein TadG
MQIAKSTRAFTGRRGCNRGESLVEFAIVSTMFFLLIFGIIDFGRLFYAKTTLESAVREAGRFAVTGRHLTDASGNPLGRVKSISDTAKKYAMGINISNILIKSPQGGASYPAGGPRQTVIISMTSNFQVITPFIARYIGQNGVYPITVSTTFLNEPFDPSQTN